MKKIIVLFVILFSVSAVAMESEPPAKEEKEKPPEVWCPATRFTDNSKCMDCHQMITENGKPKFGLKELGIMHNYPSAPYGVIIKRDATGLYAYVEVTATNSAKFRNASDYLAWHPGIKRLVVDIFSGGGSVMDAWAAVGIIKEMQGMGIVVETRCYGLAASAATILLVAGDIGHRYVSPNSQLMLHKIWTFSMFSVSTPDSAEDQAATLKHFQENINGFILARSKMTREQLYEGIFKKDFWMTGVVAVALGLADRFIGGGAETFGR